MRAPRRAAIPQVQYHPPGGYRLDLEVFPLSRIRRVVPAAERLAPRRLEFWLLIYLRGPASRHMVDFEAVTFPAGAVMLLRPGQVHGFGTTPEGDGWMVPFQPEFLRATAAGPAGSPGPADAAASLLEFPLLSKLSSEDQAAVAESLARMHADSQRQAPTQHLHALLRHQLLTIMTRLALAHAQRPSTRTTTLALEERGSRFRQLLERDFRAHHEVSHYARRLGCSEKSLVRAAWEVDGASPKSLISRRLALEAKRLLAHTDLQVAQIADQLGFAEATNFVKFFRREAKRSPGEFRKQQAAR